MHYVFITRCICGVLADKLVVLVTHQLQYAQHADTILVLKEVWVTLVLCKFNLIFAILRDVYKDMGIMKC